MIRSMLAMALLIMTVNACTSGPPKREAAHQPTVDPPIGKILRRFAIERSFQECKAKSLSDEQCKKSIDDAQKHLDSVNARLDVVLKDPKTNMCDLVRFSAACTTPIHTLGDLADCLQLLPDRAEALNSGRFVFKLDSRGCPTDAK
jgi:hypothetical protein